MVAPGLFAAAAPLNAIVPLVYLWRRRFPPAARVRLVQRRPLACRRWPLAVPSHDADVPEPCTLVQKCGGRIARTDTFVPVTDSGRQRRFVIVIVLPAVHEMPSRSEQTFPAGSRATGYSPATRAKAP